MSQAIEVKVPDIGDFSLVPVIELCVKAGDAVEADAPLITLESDKATMDVPAPRAGVVKELRVALGDRVSEGTVIALLEAAADEAAGDQAPAAVSPAAKPAPAPPTPAAPRAPVPAPRVSQSVEREFDGKAHASPSVRQFARELGVDLVRVTASGPKGRVLKEDVSAFVKGVMRAGPATAPGVGPGLGGAAPGGLELLPWPKIDFAKFGPVETRPLSRIKKISGQNLARNWVMIPAVTYHEDADITELEAFRMRLNKENEKSGPKVTMLAFLIKACEIALKKFPEFNSSLTVDENGEPALALKKYYHIAFAADTPNGLVVPVIRNVDQKAVSQLAVECGELAKKARDGKLGPADMSGACFTISSVGGLGGTAFSPIVNAPEVAILGVSRSATKPVWNGKEFVPRLILPLSLSADHRVIDGALATRFNAYLARLLEDFRRVTL
ncbi:MAG: dihydrolipoyllysine-residue acetyltransferase [Candidatus Accumulibacter sp.]|jgi:pyruvate dehydrogenase E2 component (dihydrolipoamide acetyltransferase)|nr:dihydrolipoyllysine-residue acetyltransferase [Accumulibacter sp.]